MESKQTISNNRSPSLARGPSLARTPIIIGAVLSAVVLFGVFLFYGNLRSGAKEQENSRESRDAGPRIEKYLVKAGDTWDVISQKSGIGQELGARILQLSEDAHNLASIRAGNEFRFNFDSLTNEFVGLEYDIDKENYLLIEKNNAEEMGFGIDIRDIEYETKEVIKLGVIESSLFETAQEEGISPGVILNLAMIFSWDVDFASSVYEGDSFSVVYEDKFRDGEYVGAGRILAARFTNAGKDFFAFFYEDPSGYRGYYGEDGREARRQFLKSPLDYKRITSGFSYSRFHPILNTFTSHRAIDYAAPSGTPVSATAKGTVTYAGWKSGYGKFVEIKHANGYRTAYAHLSAFAAGIRSGAKVEQNQVVAFVGSTGLSTGPHLHYEMRKNGVPINPLSLDLPKGDMMNKEYLPEFFNIRDAMMERLGIAKGAPLQK